MHDTWHLPNITEAQIKQKSYFIKKVPCQRWDAQDGDAESARRLSGECDVMRISTKSHNVFLHPLQGEHLVVECLVARKEFGISPEKTQPSKSVVHGDHHHISLGEWEKGYQAYDVR